MKIFSWMNSKLTGRQVIKKKNSTAADTNYPRQDSEREEFSDWPHGLLAIGTFGNDNNLKQELGKCRLGETCSTFEDHLQDITPEEANDLQKDITHILNKQQGRGLLETHNNEDDIIGRLERSTSVVLNQEKDIHTDQMRGSIGKKSLSFILNKILIRRSGFAPPPSLRDPIPDNSRVEKILRAMLHKKIYPQNSNPKAMAKKYLETNRLNNSDSDDEMFDAENDRSKWVKTDSDFIVLEI